MATTRDLKKSTTKKATTKKIDGRGGARPGAGRPTPNKIEGEKKVNITIMLYPSQRKKLISQFGSVQKAIDSIEI